jgi:hypothetical protein
VEETRGTLPLSAVLVGPGAGEVPEAAIVARSAGEAGAGEAADAGIDRLPGDLLAVVFDGRPRADALAAAVTALQEDPGLGGVLLAARDAPGPPRGYDPLSTTDAGAAIVLRRDAWLATRGFAAGDPPAGFEAWALAVGCLAQGVRTARVAGALDGGGPVAPYEADARRRVLARHPELAARRALDAEAERDRLSAQLEQLRTTRSWRLVTGWWRLRERMRGRRRAG